MQKELSRNLFKSFGIPVLEIKEVEADDVIATLVKKYSKDFEIRIITSDKDLMQLVSYNVFLYDTLKEKEIREKEVIEKVLNTKCFEGKSFFEIYEDIEIINWA